MANSWHEQDWDVIVVGEGLAVSTAAGQADTDLLVSALQRERLVLVRDAKQEAHARP